MDNGLAPPPHAHRITVLALKRATAQLPRVTHTHLIILCISPARMVHVHRAEALRPRRQCGSVQRIFPVNSHNIVTLHMGGKGRIPSKCIINYTSYIMNRVAQNCTPIYKCMINWHFSSSSLKMLFACEL